MSFHPPVNFSWIETPASFNLEGRNAPTLNQCSNVNWSYLQQIGDILYLEKLVITHYSNLHRNKKRPDQGFDPSIPTIFTSGHLHLSEVSPRGRGTRDSENSFRRNGRQFHLLQRQAIQPKRTRPDKELEGFSNLLFQL